MSEPQPETIPMPNLIGLTTQAAYNTLEADGVNTIQINQYGPGAASTDPSNNQYVADQSPCAGTPLEDTGATLWAVDNEGTNSFPDVENMNYEAAKALLQSDYDLVIAQAGIGSTVKSAQMTASDCPVSTGTTVNVGAEVTLVTQRPVGGGDVG